MQLRREDFDLILQVKPGITGLSRLAFARESELLDPADRLGDYLQRVLPQKIVLDRTYVARTSDLVRSEHPRLDAHGHPLRREVAVNRQTTKLTVRRRRADSQLATHPAGLTMSERAHPLREVLLHSASTSPEEPTRSWN